MSDPEIAKRVGELFRQGQSKAEIAKAIGKDKKTVEKLLAQAHREASHGR